MEPLNERLPIGTLVWAGRNVGQLMELKVSGKKYYAKVLVLAGVNTGQKETWLQWRRATDDDLQRIRRWYTDQAFKLSEPMRVSLAKGDVLDIESP